MARVSKHDQLARKSLYNIGYEYLCNNFQNFKESNKIKIAIAIMQIEKARPMIDQSSHTHFTVIVPKGFDGAAESNSRINGKTSISL